MLQKLSRALFFVLLFGSCCLNAEDWDKRVYLASYPRSGNHWLRYLIEEATGIATSSVYCDTGTLEYQKSHLPTMFPWGYCPKNGYEGTRRYPAKDDLIVIKTHYPFFPPQPLDNKIAIKTICVLRHPVDSFFAQHLRVPPQGRVTDSTMNEFLFEWRKFQEYWQREKNVVHIRYEDLYNSPFETLKEVLQAIGYKVLDSDVERAVKRYPPKGGTLKYLQHFKPEDLKIIEHKLAGLMKKYHYKIPRKYKTKKSTPIKG